MAGLYDNITFRFEFFSNSGWHENTTFAGER